MKKKGFTLIELLVATGIAAIFLSSATQIFGQIYLSQKKIEISQSLYDESQFFIEKLSKLMQENIIDYDRYFEEIGPNITTCSFFDSRQLPASFSTTNTLINRRLLDYKNVFYWDTNNNGLQDTNLGGKDEIGNLDECTMAFSGIIDVLYLINPERTIKTAITKNATGEIQIEKKLGASRNNNQTVDFWSSITNDFSGNICQIEDPTSPGDFYNILGKNSASFCEEAYQPTVISPKIMSVDAMTFLPNPDRDPFLAFNVSEVRIQPNVFVSMKTSLRDPQKYNFTNLNKPWILLQTTISSRIFGNTR